MAYIYKRGDVWAYRIQAGIDLRTGRYKQIGKSGFKRKKDAQFAAGEAEAALRDGDYVPGNKTTFSTFATEWLQMYAASAKESSVRIRRHEIALLLEFFANAPLQSITGKQYQQALLSLTESGFAKGTVAGVHTCAGMIFRKALEYRLIKRSPTEFARPPRRPSRSIEQATDMPRYLEKQELAAFPQTSAQSGLPGDYAMFMLLAYTGMRIGECLALTWEDVSLEERTVNISKTLYCPDNNALNYKLVSPKTAKGYRVIDVPAVVTGALAAWRKEYLLEKIRFGNEWHTDYSFIFPASKHHGYPRMQKAVQCRIDRLSALLESPLSCRLTPHVFRHTHISLPAEAGVPLHEIMDRVGQADENTTKTIYLHVTQHRKKEAARLFDSLMNAVIQH